MTNTKASVVSGWLARWTAWDEMQTRWLDAPSEGLSAWARTTAGVAAMLLVVQFVTGILLAFHYVPSAENAYLTVAYMEKVVGAGSWARSLHYHTSQWLPFALVLHLGQMLWRRAYGRVPVAWLGSLVLLGLALGAATTGYALPWDARSLNGANIGANLAGGLPLLGGLAQRWIQSGDGITTLTLSRFYALHVFVTPALILLCVAARLFVFRDRENANADWRGWASAQLTRNAIIVSLPTCHVERAIRKERRVGCVVDKGAAGLHLQR